MLNPHYYEAIIQLRPYKPEVYEFITQQIKNRKDIFISKVNELKTGIDIYISDQRFARSLGKKLKNKFKGKLVLSRKLHTVSRRTSKPLYRVTILFRLA